MLSTIFKGSFDYIEKSGVKAMILGVSGGIDSAVIAAIAHEINKINNVPLIGRSIPIETNKPEEIHRANLIGKAFCNDYKEIDLSNAYKALTENIEIVTNDADDTANKINHGNIKARLRMIQLYHLANANKGLVLSTDNLTELFLGFWTLHGDVGDFAPIQNLWKTEVYELAWKFVELYRAEKSFDKAEALIACIDAVPTDGLGITNSDLDQIGASSYEEVDSILKEYFSVKDKKGQEEYGSTIMRLEAHPVIKRYNATHFKRDNPFNLDYMGRKRV